MKICYLDAFSGISGDMTVGALLDAGASFDALQEGLNSLETRASFRAEKTRRKGIAATKFHVDAPEADDHRHLHNITQIIEAGQLTERVRRDAKAIFQRLAEAEARSHATSIDKVHFHEVGAVDSICDIVGACICFDNLGIETVACAPINTGSGTVKTEHGVLPVPAPATAELLTGKPIYARGPAKELTTPTGAAIAATLATHFGPMAPMTLTASGYGAGTADFPDHANVLRVLIGEASGATEATAVDVIEANIDDTTPQILAYAMDRLLSAGALDVTLTPVLMKKGRPGTVLTVIAQPQDREPLAAILLSETTTLGLRHYTAERRVQARTFTEVLTPYGTVRIKIGPAGAFTPEYEDCRKLAESRQIPLKQILAEASSLYLQTRR